MRTHTQVLITEYMDESLVLLRRKNCWDLDAILYHALKVKTKVLEPIDPQLEQSINKVRKRRQRRRRLRVEEQQCSVSVRLVVQSAISVPFKLTICVHIYVIFFVMGRSSAGSHLCV